MEDFKPFWRDSYIQDEILVFCEENGRVSANLLFDCQAEVEIRNRNGDLLTNGRDYLIDKNEVALINRSLAYFNQGDLEYNETKILGFPHENDQYKIKDCTLVEPHYLRQMQYMASYRHAETNFPKVISDYICLPKTYNLLSKDKRIKVALFGDSICNAANSSFEMGFENCNHWFYDSVEYAKCLYDAQIEVINISRSGYDTNWGAEAVEEKLRGQNVDLLVIGFGMNDGSARMSVQKYCQNIASIMRQAKKINHNMEFILISPPAPNILSKQIYGKQKDYLFGLLQFEAKGIAVVDMTSISEFLIARKRYCEISGNNLNHPNDFFYKIYSDSFKYLFSYLKQRNESRLDWGQYLSVPKFEEIHLDALPSNIIAGYIVTNINNKEYKTFAFVGKPLKSQNHLPAVVLCHGAGGNAFLEWVKSWTDKGFVAIAIDLNGTKFDNDDLKDRKPNLYAGNVCVGGFDSILKDGKDSWIYYSVAVILSAHSYILSLDCVDKSKTGLVGISWGGVVGLSALGVDERFATGAIIYSAGMISEDLLGQEQNIFNDYNKKKFYDNYFDATNYVHNIKVPMLFNAGLDDAAFSPHSRSKTAKLIDGDNCFSIRKTLYHDNESNFNNINVYSFISDVLLATKLYNKIKLKFSQDSIEINVGENATKVELLTTSGTGNPHIYEWITSTVDTNNGIANIKTYDIKAKYGIIVAYYEEGKYSSSDIFAFLE